MSPLLWSRAVAAHKWWRLISLFVLIAACLFVVSFLTALVGGFQEPFLAPLTIYPGVVSMHYFDDQGQALLQGHLDVPCDSINAEAFVIGGKCYGYFGLWPTLVRMPLNALFPDFYGLWPRVMMIAGGFFTFVGCWLLARRALGKVKKNSLRPMWAALFALFAVTGSTLFFIVSDPYPYHEVILWASAFALWALWATGRYSDTGKISYLAASLLFAFITIHARVTTGLGVIAVMVMCFSAPFWRRPAFGKIIFSPQARGYRRSPAALAILLLIGIAATPILINFSKFGQASPPFEKHQWTQAFPGRLQKIEGGSFRAANFSCAAAIYFSPDNIATNNQFPWVIPGQPDYWFAPEQKGMRVQNTLNSVAFPCFYTYVESLDPSFSVIYAEPALVLLAFVGLITLARRPKEIVQYWAPLLLSGCLIGLPTLFFQSVTYRYEHDFFPFMAIAACLGWQKIITLQSWTRAAAIMIVTLCTCGGFWVNFVAAETSGSPQPYMQQLGYGVAHLFNAIPPSSE